MMLIRKLQALLQARLEHLEKQEARLKNTRTMRLWEKNQAQQAKVRRLLEVLSNVLEKPS